ncbi:hypothetical protein CRI94_15130 [Longibacter salinarum]|uniref:Uncharacterized protein n=1 Tax=Longibacter salinarum TaxID=1850348 RepID=A0A2A8CUD8_9BACT|nr:hypothetical protein [Longibacter salinarum]PEN11370.1 hypothetical protein CRI94_15130 [Longibacter salinarum]
MDAAPHLPPPTRQASSATSRIAYALLLGIMIYVAALLAGDVAIDGRRVGLRMWALFSAGVFAVAAPNVLAPDPNAPVMQLLNRTPLQLLSQQLKRWGAVLTLFVLPVWVLAFFDTATPMAHLGAKLSLAFQATGVVLATGLYSFDVYATIGAVSQEWHEGKRGDWYQSVKQSGYGFDVPMGLVPALFATVRCFGAGIIVVLVGATLFGAAPALAWLPGVLFLIWSTVRILRHRLAFDRHYYHTNAFYDEVLGGGSVGPSTREPVEISSLYWIPHRFRPAAWMSLRQLDRRLPLGRLVALGHVVFWILLAQEAATAAITSTLLLIVGLQNGVIGLLAGERMSAPTLQLTLHSPMHWWGARTLANLRWMAPLLASLAVVATVSNAMPWSSLGVWAVINLIAAVVAAGLTTLAVEGRTRRQFR